MTRVTPAHLEARKDSILVSALRVFARKGIQFATMAEIADDAGISAGAIYRYFPGKDALIEACFEENVEQMTSEWHRQVEATPNPLEALLEISRKSFEHMEEELADDVTRVMIERMLDGSRMNDETWRQNTMHERETVVRGLMEPIVRAQEQGILPAGIDAYQTAQSMVSFYYGVRLAKLLGTEIDARAQLESYCHLLKLVSESHLATTASVKRPTRTAKPAVPALV